MHSSNKQNIDTFRSIFIWLALITAVSFLVSFGILGIGRGSTEPFADVRYWYLASKILLAEGSPYDYTVFLNTSRQLGFGHIERYVYPPHSIPFVVTLSYFTIGIAKTILGIVNVMLLLALIVGNQRLLSEREIEVGNTPSVTSAAFIAVAMLASPFSANVIWIGQMTLIVSAALVLGWRLLTSGQPLIGGALLGIATIKPQLSILFIVWLAVTRNYRALVGASVAVFIMSIPAFLMLGPSSIQDWLTSLGSYQSAAPIVKGLSYNTNIKSLLTAFGFQLPASSTWFFTAIGVVAVFVASRMVASGWLHPRDALPLLTCISLLLIFGRDYDLAAIFPVLPAMCWHLRRRPVAQAVGLSLLITMFLPHRWVSLVGIDWLLCWRIITLIAITVWLAWLSIASPHGGPKGLGVGHRTS